MTIARAAMTVLAAALVAAPAGPKDAARGGRRDRTPPSCTLAAPVSAPSNPFAVTVDAHDARGVARVRLTVDGAPAGERTRRPYRFDVTAERFPARVCATAVDRAGNSSAEACRDVAAPPAASGCRRNEDCAAGEYCAKALGDCDGAGSCKARPQACFRIFAPACGCDGHTYGNGCDAAMAGVNVRRSGECAR